MVKSCVCLQLSTNSCNAYGNRDFWFILCKECSDSGWLRLVKSFGLRPNMETFGGTTVAANLVKTCHENYKKYYYHKFHKMWENQ